MRAAKVIGLMAAGAGIGAFVTWKYLINIIYEWKDAYEDQRQYYEDRIHILENEIGSKDDEGIEWSNEETPKEEKPEPEEKKTFRSTLKKTSYDKMFNGDDDEDESPASKESPPEDPEEPQPPYIITPQEYSKSSLSKSTLTYYINSDVLVEEDDIIDNPDYSVGREFKDRFGEYEEDVVFVRNEKLGVDFEIICDHTAASMVTEILGYEV